MPWFKCLMEGKNFPGALMQQDGLLGFFATRAVEAASMDDAEVRALELLRADPSFVLPTGVTASEDARVFFVSIVQIDEFEAASIGSKGASWYPMDEMSS